MAKKTQAQIRRLQERAKARGEVYVPPPLVEKVEERDEEDENSGERNHQEENDSDKPVKDEETTKRQVVARKLKEELEGIEKNEEIKAKDRRSAKRKAEAIAAQETGMPAQELLEWYEEFLKSQPAPTSSQETTDKKRNHDPYIAFVGQLSFETTQGELFQHIQEQLKNDFKKPITKKDVKIRMLTDGKTQKSRGMAFIEVGNPELLYGLLKFHQTFLNGRRINVERSAGGKKNSEARKSKITQYRKEQDEYFAQVVDNILKEYKDTGELRDGELDEGVISLCKRHAGPVVRAAIAEYMEKGGRDMDNPSAYLTFLVTKFAEEGIREDKEESSKTASTTKTKKTQMKRSSSNPISSGPNKRFKQSSEFGKAGVDMSISEKKNGGSSEFTRIFPSARRGRGRGYM